MIIREAGTRDVIACVALVETRRQIYEQYEPRFWKKATNSGASTNDWFCQLLDDASTVGLVAEEGGTIVGFLIAREFPTPPAYEPGGPTALIDDFCVVAADRWIDVGAQLVKTVRTELRRRGFAQIIVVGADKDLAKKEFLESTDLSLASTWWTAAT